MINQTLFSSGEIMRKHEMRKHEKKNKPVDYTGHKCEKCHKGTYKETRLQDDWQGVLHCDKCNYETNRWHSEE